MNKLTEHAAALHGAINAIPEESRAFVLNYVSKNAHRPLKEMLARLERSLMGKLEAEAIDAHRKEKVLQDYAQMTGQSVEVVLQGLASAAQQGEPGKKKGK